MTGVPRELGSAPRQHTVNYVAQQPSRDRKRAARGAGKGKQPAMGAGALEPITERPQHPHQHQTQYQQDASTSTTDLAGQLVGGVTGQGLSGQGQGGLDGDAPKTGKAQTNAFAKILSAALRR
jgi:hypothetical protein